MFYIRVLILQATLKIYIPLLQDYQDGCLSKNKNLNGSWVIQNAEHLVVNYVEQDGSKESTRRLNDYNTQAIVGCSEFNTNHEKLLKEQQGRLYTQVDIYLSTSGFRMIVVYRFIE